MVLRSFEFKWAISLVVEQRSPKPLAGVRFPHRPPIMENIEKRKGESFVLFGSLIWSLFPIVIVLSLANISGLISLAWSIVFATIFFFFIILYRQTWHFFKNINFWKMAFYIAVNGVAFYSLYYLGLEKTTPGNAGLIGLIEILLSFLFFNIFRKEHISKDHKIGVALMTLGGLIIFSRNFSEFNAGDFLILLAIFCGPIGNYLQQQIRKTAPIEHVLFARYLISIPLTFFIAYIFNRNISFIFHLNSLLFLMFNGLIIFGFGQILWVEAIHRISVTKAIALNSITPLLTLVFAWMILNQVPTLWQISSTLPLLIGTLLLTDSIKYKDYVPFI